MYHTISILIPTYNRPEMLERTLGSLSKAIWPNNFVGVWIVENGPVVGAKDVVNKFAKSIPVHYVHEETLGLSFARNAGISNIKDDVVLLFDDDMKFNHETLIVYNDAIQKYGLNYFYGGALEPDYEKEPPEWLVKYLPFSAKGFSLGNKTVEICTPSFLGGNHAVPKWIFEKVGGYDSCCATGEQGGVGEEKRLQIKMLKLGLKGIYLPDAIVHHFVPENRTSTAWILNREFRHGITDALDIKKISTEGKNVLGVPFWLIKKLILSLLRLLLESPFKKDKSKSFEIHREYLRTKGTVHALIRNKKSTNNRLEL